MRQHRAVQVILSQQRREHIALALVLWRGEEVRFAAGDASLFDVQHRPATFVCAPVKPPYVRVGTDAGDDLLALAKCFHRANAVAQERRTLKVQRLRLALHLLAHGAREAAIVA